MKKVLVTAPGFDLFGNDGKEALAGAGLAFEIVKGQQNLSVERLLELLPAYDALIVGSDEVTKAMLERTHLKVISKHGVGIDNIDLEAAAARRIMVCNVPGSILEDAVADFTLTLILSLAKEIVIMDRETKQGGWKKRAGRTLQTSVLGVLGMGRIGKNIARKARALGMSVLGWDLRPDRNFAVNHGVEYVGFEDLLRNADFVSLNVPLSNETKGLIGTAQLQMMKQGSYLINTGRGGLVNEQALYNALRAGHLAGAALDTFGNEPPAGSPLLDLDNVIATPHTAAYTPETLRAVSRTAAENVVAALNGIPQHLCSV
jgi:D-3-phosphoglycerate dehydrogenase